MTKTHFHLPGGDGDFDLGSTIESQFTDLKLCCLDNLGSLWINFRLIFWIWFIGIYLWFVICYLWFTESQGSLRHHDDIPWMATNYLTLTAMGYAPIPIRFREGVSVMLEKSASYDSTKAGARPPLPKLHNSSFVPIWLIDCEGAIGLTSSAYW